MSEKIPEGWRRVKLGEVIALNYGKSLPERKRIKGNIPVYSSAGVTGWHNKALVDSKGIIIGRKGTIGKVYKSDTPFFAIDTCYYVLPDDKNYDFDFMYYLLLNLNLDELNEDSAVPGLNRNTAYSLEIIIPESLDEQRSIASVLSSLDDKIDLLHRQNKTLEVMAETLYENWIWKKEFDSTIKELIDIQNGYAFKSKNFQDSGNHRVLKIKNISGNIVDLQTTDYVSDEIISNLDKRFKIKTGDILFAMTGAKIGKMGIIPQTEYSLWLNQRVGLFKEKYKGVRFLAYLHLKSDFGIDYIENTATGSAQPNISANSIENCPFPRLSNKELRNYGVKIKVLFDRIIHNLGQIRKLEKLRDTLLPKLMSGEVRVKF